MVHWGRADNLTSIKFSILDVGPCSLNITNFDDPRNDFLEEQDFPKSQNTKNAIEYFNVFIGEKLISQNLTNIRCSTLDLRSWAPNITNFEDPRNAFFEEQDFLKSQSTKNVTGVL